MMSDSQRGAYVSALADFRDARRRATLERVMSALSGQSTELLSYDDVRQRLDARETARRTLKEVPLDAIVGSVGRYNDFSRTFLPRQDQDAERWAEVKAAMTGLIGLPPVELYQVGDVYFVRDGNHRISVLRQMGASHAEAYVTQVRTKVPLSPDVQPDDLIIKEEHTRFLRQTRLDELRPGSDLTVTVPGMYDVLLEHIAVHRYFMGIDHQREIPYHEAVTHWYDAVYLPVVEIIRDHSILTDFPGRTETDLYLWVVEHREALKEFLGWDLSTEAAASDLAAGQRRPGPGTRMLQAATPAGLEAGPPPGEWRRSEVETRRQDVLFADVLVALGSGDEGWPALDQALLVADRDHGRVHGLHIVADESDEDDTQLAELRERFEQHCKAAGLPGKLAIQSGEISTRVCHASRLVDLLVLGLKHPPGTGVARRLGSGFRGIIRRCSRPVLAVPGEASPLSRALLAYDGSPKSNEALFVATYLAARWKTELLVLAVDEKSISASAAQDAAREYLTEHGVEAEFRSARGSVAEEILRTVGDHDFNLILMGGYSASPLVEVVVGSEVDEVLRSSSVPILVCR
jgi:nucleotide-binding universal stress UspA family protein